MVRNFLILFSLLVCGMLYAQQPEIQSTSFNISKLHSFSPKNIKEDWRVNVVNLGSEVYRPSDQKSTRSAAQIPDYGSYSRKKAATSDLAPVIGQNFEVHPNDYGTPNDNDVAINNDGILISVINSNINVIDTKTDSLLLDAGLKAFTNILNFKGDFDPKILFDPEEEKWIFIYLMGGLSASQSEMIVAFSETSDPLGNWNVYSLPGNPLNDNSWSDFPQIALTNDDLLIAIGLSANGQSDSGGVREGIIWQIDKLSGFGDSSSLSTTLYNGITGNGIPFEFIQPIQGGSVLQGPEVYVIANRTYPHTATDTFWLITIDGTQKDTPNVVSVEMLNTDVPYYDPANGLQPDTSELATNGAFVLGGFIEDSIIHFVTNTQDVNLNRPAVYHGIYDLRNPGTMSGNIISDPGLDHGYPNIAFTGNANRYSAVIVFDHTSLDTFAGLSVMYWDDQNGYSERTTVVNGENIVDVLPSNFTERWGDYTGIQPVYNEEGSCWISGYYATTRGSTPIGSSWVAKIENPELSTGIGIQPISKKHEHRVFPNPSLDQTTISFTLDAGGPVHLSLYDMQGKLLKVLYDGFVKKGQNELMFSTKYLAPGKYMIVGELNNGRSFSRPLIKQ